jgi:hypothetical protein
VVRAALRELTATLTSATAADMRLTQISMRSSLCCGALESGRVRGSWLVAVARPPTWAFFYACRSLSPSRRGSARVQELTGIFTGPATG